MSEVRSIIGKFIHSRWIAMNIRAGKYRHIQTKNKCLTYKNINIEFSQPEFKKWCYDNKEYILSLTRPSIDRINKNLNYTLENIQIIELIENIRKDKIKAKNGRCECYRCKQTKSLDLFSKESRRINGKATICRECDNLRKKKIGKKNNAQEN